MRVSPRKFRLSAAATAAQARRRATGPAGATKHARVPASQDRAELTAFIYGAHDIEIRRKQRRQRSAEVRVHQLADAAVPFAAAHRFCTGEVVEARSGVRLDHAERSWLTAQIVQDPAKHRVLENVGEVTGVEFVLIIHGPNEAPGLCHSTLEA